MKQRILSGWTIQRGLYLVLGIVIFIQSIMDKQWFGIIFGIYFASMGLLALGCAGGKCYNVNRNYGSDKKITTTIADVEYEEIK